MTPENPTEETTTIQYSMFAVDDTPHCLWDWDIGARNMEFINSIDPGYFEHIANIHSQFLEDKENQYAATALRIAYFHGLETLFALLCATLQAPDCVVGWMLRYRNSQLDSVVKKISDRRSIYSKFRAKRFSWDVIATLILSRFSTGDAEKDKRIIESYGRLWANFAADFLNENLSHEYNSMKHGSRTKLGGFYLSMGLEDTPGVAASPEKMHVMGQSKFGSSFFISEKLRDRDPRNFRIRRQSLNWNPENLLNGLLFISMSISNVLSFLKIINGVKESEVQFFHPTDEASFEEPWKRSTGINAMGFGSGVEEIHTRTLSKEDILSVYSEEQNSSAETEANNRGSS